MKNTQLKITHREYIHHNYGRTMTISRYIIRSLFWKCNCTLKHSLTSHFSSHSNLSTYSCIFHVNFNYHIIFSSHKNNLLNGFISLTHATQLCFLINVYNSEADLYRLFELSFSTCMTLASLWHKGNSCFPVISSITIWKYNKQMKGIWNIIQWIQILWNCVTF